jgi:hypothetical protein
VMIGSVHDFRTPMHVNHEITVFPKRNQFRPNYR